MGSPTKCFSAARAFLSPELMADMETRAAELRSGGAGAAAAARQAVSEAMLAVETRLAAPEPPKTDAAARDGEPPSITSGGAIDQVRAQFPDLMVQMDGMDKPMRLDDFLASVKAEADEMAADAPLMQVAAECALLHAA